MHIFKSGPYIEKHLSEMPALMAEFEKLVDSDMAKTKSNDPGLWRKTVYHFCGYWVSPYNNPHTNGAWIAFLYFKGVLPRIF